jgi:uncharacterized protein HemX
VQRLRKQPDSAGRARGALLLWLVALAVTGYVGYRYVDFGALHSAVPWHAAGEAKAPPHTSGSAAPANAPELAASPATSRASSASSEPAQPSSANDAAATGANDQADIEQRVARVEGELARLSADLAAHAPADRAWQLAELRYLLRIADHRARLEHDGAGAASLLDVAADLLTSLDDRSLDPVRVAVDASRQALASTPSVDLDALHDRLAALRQSVEVLPVKLPKYAPTVQPSDSAETTHDGLERLLERLRSLVDFRTRDAAEPPPLLRPEDERYLRLNLMLTVEAAEVGALRRDDATYRKSLVELDTAVAQYFEPSDERVVHMRDEIGQLERVQLSVALPDLSGALRALDSRSTAGNPDTTNAVAATPSP